MSYSAAKGLGASSITPSQPKLNAIMIGHTPHRRYRRLQGPDAAIKREPLRALLPLKPPVAQR
jgi:hypothetical protein